MLARGELTVAEFDALLTPAVRQSKVGASRGSVPVERTSAGGTALELAVATTFLPGEHETLFGAGTLYATSEAWRDTARRLTTPPLPAAGAMGVALQSGYAGIGLSPAEFNSDKDQRLLVLPAAGIVAGALAGTANGDLQRRARGAGQFRGGGAGRDGCRGVASDLRAAQRHRFRFGPRRTRRTLGLPGDRPAVCGPRRCRSGRLVLRRSAAASGGRNQGPPALRRRGVPLSAIDQCGGVRIRP